MFRFGRFDIGDASSPSIEGEQQPQQPQDGVSNTSSSNSSNKSTSFLQRMASADTLLRSSAPLMKRPSFSSLQNSFSSSSGSSIASSFSIPVPTNSWGMLALSRLRAADDGEFDDVIDLLLTRDKVSSIIVIVYTCVCVHWQFPFVGRVIVTSLATIASIRYHRSWIYSRSCHFISSKQWYVSSHFFEWNTRHISKVWKGLENATIRSHIVTIVTNSLHWVSYHLNEKYHLSFQDLQTKSKWHGCV